MTKRINRPKSNKDFGRFIVLPISLELPDCSRSACLQAVLKYFVIVLDNAFIISLSYKCLLALLIEMLG